MELKRDQLVVFENGHKASNLEVIWDRKHEAFCLVTDDLDEEGNRIRLYSTTVVDKPIRARSKFTPSAESCTVQILPVGETEKAYQVPDGSNGKIGHRREFFRYIAKSICYVKQDGAIFAPSWATKNLDH